MIMKTNKVHIGKVIRRVMAEQQLHPETVAAKLDIAVGSFYRLTRKEHLNSKRLMQFGNAIGHDFFQYLQKDNGERERQKTVMDENMKLKKQVEDVTRERDTYKMQVSYLEEQVRGQKELIAMLRK
jgi:uncharacterized protein YlxW (UPF0749 family)